MKMKHTKETQYVLKAGFVLITTILLVTGSLVSAVGVPGDQPLPLDDITAPIWQNQAQEKTTVWPGGSIWLRADGKDETALNFAWLSTNETGVWENQTRGNWWNSAWQYSKVLTIDHNAISDTDGLYNFPVYVSITVPVGGARPDGYDFFHRSIHTIQYAREIDLTPRPAAQGQYSFVTIDDTPFYIMAIQPPAINRTSLNMERNHSWFTI
jgi:hypothetical protein